MAEDGKEVRLYVEPGHYYSPINDPAESEAYYGSDRYLRQCARVDALLDMQAMVAFWKKLAPLTVDFPFRKAEGFRYFGRNNMFQYFDATILSGLLRWLDPRRIIEVGSGYSSAAMFDTLDRMKKPRLAAFTTIDPDQSRIRRLSPPTFAEVIPGLVQDQPPERFSALDAGDLLFIDSSHVMKTASDVHYLFLHILPALKPGVVVHVHDIFYPFEYPKRWNTLHNRSWNEIYIVDTLLTHGQSFEVLFMNHAFVTKARDQVREPGDMFDRFRSFDTLPVHNLNGSIFLRRRPAPKPPAKRAAPRKAG